MRINHNIAALNTYRQLSANNTNTSKAIEKLSSGLRINRAGDDAAGLAISEKMRGQIAVWKWLQECARQRFFDSDSRRCSPAKHIVFCRGWELAVQSANDTNDILTVGNYRKK